MKELTVHDSFGTTTLNEIRQFEDKLHAKLPAAYIEFLLRYNGGRFVESSFYPLEKVNPNDDDYTGGIEWFFGLFKSEYYNIEDECRRMQDRMPGEFLSIGRSPFGDRICLCLGSGMDYGKVYYWFHEEEADDDEAPTYDNLYLIANNFTDFINSLFEYKLPDN